MYARRLIFYMKFKSKTKFYSYNLYSTNFGIEGGNHLADFVTKIPFICNKFVWKVPMEMSPKISTIKRFPPRLIFKFYAMYRWDFSHFVQLNKSSMHFCNRSFFKIFFSKILHKIDPNQLLFLFPSGLIVGSQKMFYCWNKNN